MLVRRDALLQGASSSSRMPLYIWNLPGYIGLSAFQRVAPYRGALRYADAVCKLTGWCADGRGGNRSAALYVDLGQSLVGLDD